MRCKFYLVLLSIMVMIGLMIPSCVGFMVNNRNVRLHCEDSDHGNKTAKPREKGSRMDS